MSAPIFAGIQQLQERPEHCVVVDVRGTLALLHVPSGTEVSTAMLPARMPSIQVSRTELNATVFASPTILENGTVLIAAESGAVLLVDPVNLNLMRRFHLPTGKLVRAPSIVGTHLFFMLTSGIGRSKRCPNCPEFRNSLADADCHCLKHERAASGRSRARYRCRGVRNAAYNAHGD